MLKHITNRNHRNIQFSTRVPLASNEITTHKTFMDTLGRPTLTLTALNVVDDWRDKDLVITYDYPWTAGYRKPLTIAAGLGSLLLGVYLISSVDTSIGRRKVA
jgi:oligosaccharyltransferase complex subunit alpha (ribophorin I)